MDAVAVGWHEQLAREGRPAGRSRKPAASRCGWPRHRTTRSRSSGSRSRGSSRKRRGKGGAVYSMSKRRHPTTSCE